MSGPLSVPMGDKRLSDELREKLCVAHIKYDAQGNMYHEMPYRPTPCEIITYREWYLRRNRLYTGKTR